MYNLPNANFSYSWLQYSLSFNTTVFISFNTTVLSCKLRMHRNNTIMVEKIELPDLIKTYLPNKSQRKFAKLTWVTKQSMLYNLFVLLQEEKLQHHWLLRDGFQDTSQKRNVTIRISSLKPCWRCFNRKILRRHCSRFCLLAFSV